MQWNHAQVSIREMGLFMRFAQRLGMPVPQTGACVSIVVLERLQKSFFDLFSSVDKRRIRLHAHTALRAYLAPGAVFGPTEVAWLFCEENGEPEAADIDPPPSDIVDALRPGDILVAGPGHSAVDLRDLWGEYFHGLDELPEESVPPGWFFYRPGEDQLHLTAGQVILADLACQLALGKHVIDDHVACENGVVYTWGACHNGYTVQAQSYESST